ncbi:MAG: hypothetical protein ACXIUP_04795 [Microcella sp.]
MREDSARQRRRRRASRAVAGALAVGLLTGCSAIDDGVGFVSEELAVSSAAADIATTLTELPGVQSVESEYSLGDLTLDVTLVIEPSATPGDASGATEVALDALRDEVFTGRLPTLLVVWDGAALVAQSSREIAAWDGSEVAGWVDLAAAAPVLVELDAGEAGATGRTISWPADHPVAGQRAELFEGARTLSTVAELAALVSAARATLDDTVDEAWTIPGLTNLGPIDERVRELIAALPADAPLAWPTADEIRGVGVVATPAVLSLGWYTIGAESIAAVTEAGALDLFRAAVAVLPSGGELTYASAGLQAVATLGECPDGVADSAVAGDDAEFVSILASQGIDGLIPGRCA